MKIIASAEAATFVIIDDNGNKVLGVESSYHVEIDVEKLVTSFATTGFNVASMIERIANGLPASAPEAEPDVKSDVDAGVGKESVAESLAREEAIAKAKCDCVRCYLRRQLEEAQKAAQSEPGQASNGGAAIRVGGYW